MIGENALPRNRWQPPFVQEAVMTNESASQALVLDLIRNSTALRRRPDQSAGALVGGSLKP